MEVKEVFSYISPLFVHLRGMQAPAGACIGAYEKRAFSSFNYESNPTAFAVPVREKKRRALSANEFELFAFNCRDELT